MRIRPFAAVVALALGLAGAQAQAQEFRLLNRIPTPLAPPELPPGARAVAAPRPVPVADIEAAVNDIAAAWNTPALDQRLADTFHDKPRLLSTLAAQVPRDAGLRVVSIQGAHVVLQYLMDDDNGQPWLFSRVLVTVRTQVEFNDPQRGFQRLDGVNDLMLRFEGVAP